MGKAVWALFFGSLLVSVPAGAQERPSSEGLNALRGIATRSQCVRHNWSQRGVAPRTYIEGVALVYARSVCNPDRADVKVVSAPAAGNDALVHYKAIFEAAGMRNDAVGLDTLRHSYVLLIGLGMMESAGKFCEGRDVSQCFVRAENAEAGLFQTSYGARAHSPVLKGLISSYTADTKGCMLDNFKGNISCKIRKSHNAACPEATSDIAGSGPGADWQRLTKTCPAFATEYGAVVLRKNGGARGEFGPIRKRQAEVRRECDTMLKEVQDYVEQHRDVCSAL
jgi:hypothetical protein